MSSLAALSGLPVLSAGAAINASDAIEIGPDGRAYGQEVSGLQTTDYMTTAAVGVIAAQTVSALFSGNALKRQAILRVPDGSIYIAGAIAAGSAGNVGVGIGIQRFSSILTTPVSSIAITGAGALNSPDIFLISNQTIGIVWSEGTTSPYTVCFAIVDLTLNIIAGRTVVETAASPNLHSLSFFQKTGTSAAGFVVCYQQATNTNLIRFAAYDNSGVPQGGSPVTIQTWGAAGNSATFKMGLLSNGNIGIITQGDSSTAGSLGAWVGVLSPVGASVAAFANILNTTGALLLVPPDILAMPSGYFAAVSGNATQYSAAVFNNAGVQQASNIALPVRAVPDQEKKKLLHNGTLFFFIYPGTFADINVSQITTAGANILNTQVPLTFGTMQALDAFYERNAILFAYPDGSQNKYAIISLTNFNGVITPRLTAGPTAYGTATAISHFPRVIPGGNFSFIAAYDFNYNGTGNALDLLVQKYAPSALAGVARGSVTAAEAAAAQVTPPTGGIAAVPYVCSIGTVVGCNYMGGTASVAFDMTAPTPPNIGGRKGDLTNNSISIAG